MVEYATTFTLIKPTAMSQSSGLLLYEVVNRGGSLLPRDLSSGDTFLMSGWQGDLPFRGKSVYGTDGETIQVPVARNANGSFDHRPSTLALRKYEARRVFRSDAFGRRIRILGRSASARRFGDIPRCIDKPQL